MWVHAGLVTGGLAITSTGIAKSAIELELVWQRVYSTLGPPGRLVPKYSFGRLVSVPLDTLSGSIVGVCYSTTTSKYVWDSVASIRKPREN